MTESTSFQSHRQVRHINVLFRAVFLFIKSNAATFFLSTLLVAGPFLLIAGMVAGNIFDNAFNFRNGRMVSPESVLMQNIVAFAGFLIGTAALFALIFRNVIVYEKNEGKPYELKDVLRGFFPEFLMLILNSILLYVTLFFSMMILVFLFSMMMAVVQLLDNTFITVIMAIVGIVGLLILVPVVVYMPVASLFVAQREKVNIYKAMGMVLAYLRGQFWSAWVVLMVNCLVYLSLASISQIPLIVLIIMNIVLRSNQYENYYEAVTEQHTPIWFIIFSGISSLLSIGVSIIFSLLSIYQFGNLEERRKGSRLMQQINEI